MGRLVGSHCRVIYGSPVIMGQNGGPPKLNESLTVSLAVVAFSGLQRRILHLNSSKDICASVHSVGLRERARAPC